MTERKTGLVWHERYMWHEQGLYSGLMPMGYPVQLGRHHEHPDTKRRLKNLLDACDFTPTLTPVAARMATREELLTVHTPAYLDKLETLNAAHGGEAGFDAPFTPGSVDIAKLAAGGCLEALDAVLDGRVDNVYCLVRPIGHHAEPDTGKGFCLYSNAALVARRALARGLQRVALIDIDVHHGNGAERVFWRDPQVLTISLHQSRWFPPDSGDVSAQGEGRGLGFNLNVPLPAGSGFGAYRAAFEQAVLPALERFKPELVIMPAGYDAGAQDPLGRMILSSNHFRWITEQLLAVAERHAKGRFIATHEGGYNDSTVPFMGLAVIEAMAGRASGVVDPYGAIFDGMEGHALLSHQAEAVAHAASTLAVLDAGLAREQP